MAMIGYQRDWAAFKASLRRQFEQSRRQTDALFNILDEAAFYERPIAERHRIIFYLGHFEAFDWNMICGYSFQLKPLHKDFERRFAFGIDPVNGNLPQDTASDWPSVEDVRRHNVQARKAVDECLNKVDFSRGDEPHVRNGLIFSVALEHRLMHLETLSYLLHWLPLELKQAVLPPLADVRPRPRFRQIRIPAGQTKLGLDRNDSWTFGWDNEFQRHSENVAEFEIDVYKVSNGQFLEFVEAGGYEQQSLWTEDAWNWIGANGIRHPKFWVRHGSEWWYRAMFAEIPLSSSWPVYVSHAEASAYARWQQKSLPTEAEFHRAAFGDLSVERQTSREDGNLDFQLWEPIPVDSNWQAASPFGVVGMVGNGWEWTSSTFTPFPGFERWPFYPGYSADFFDNKHFVLKGASPRTALRLTRSSFRNWFQPHYPYAYAGFRCVQR